MCLDICRTPFKRSRTRSIDRYHSPWQMFFVRFVVVTIMIDRTDYPIVAPTDYSGMRSTGILYSTPGRAHEKIRPFELK